MSYVDPTLEQEVTVVDNLLQLKGMKRPEPLPLESDTVRCVCPDCGFTFDIWYKKFGGQGFSDLLWCEGCDERTEITEVHPTVQMHAAHKRYLK